MRPAWTSSVVAACFLAGGLATSAEDAATKDDVPRVRVTTSDEETIVGSLAGLTPDELVVAQAGDKGVRLKRAAVTKLEVSQRRGNRGKAIRIGLLAGAAVGAGIGLATGEDCSKGDQIVCFDQGATTAGIGLLGAFTGSLVGLAVSHGERWQATSPDALRLVIVPRKGGLTLRLAFAF
jgi:hypothetical protein